MTLPAVLLTLSVVFTGFQDQEKGTAPQAAPGGTIPTPGLGGAIPTPGSVTTRPSSTIPSPVSTTPTPGPVIPPPLSTTPAPPVGPASPVAPTPVTGNGTPPAATQQGAQSEASATSKELSRTTSWLSLAGAFGFGALLGWQVYFINRYRKGDVGLGDLATLVGVLGGGAILALFPSGSDLFGGYGVGLAVGFFGYFGFLWKLVAGSDNFDRDWFLDGRRKPPGDGYIIPAGTAETVRAMAPSPEHERGNTVPSPIATKTVIVSEVDNGAGPKQTPELRLTEGQAGHEANGHETEP